LVSPSSVQLQPVDLATGYLTVATNRSSDQTPSGIGPAIRSFGLAETGCHYLSCRAMRLLSLFYHCK
jgi:hypothetical protein